MSKVRNFTFTFNNYPQDVAWLERLPFKYMTYGREVGESGTPHLQGFITFSSQKTLSSAIKHLPGCHVEVARTLEPAIAYCHKEGDFVEFGDRPLSPKEKGAGEKERFAIAWALAKEGKIEDIDADIRFRYLRTIKQIAMDYVPRLEPLPELANEWIYGPTGTGKTRGALERYPGAFLKLANKWWCGYAGEEVVIIDDFDKYHKSLGYELKIWGDHNPFIAETKGGSMRIRPKKIIITSNYHPLEIWEDSATTGPILRRYLESGPGLSPLVSGFNP